ncbi:MAG: hypothetical protein V2A72_01360 [Candidatus Omnitrophota bacterium]
MAIVRSIVCFDKNFQLVVSVLIAVLAFIYSLTNVFTYDILYISLYKITKGRPLLYYY